METPARPSRDTLIITICMATAVVLAVAILLLR
jgi:hypothetical protein